MKLEMTRAAQVEAYGVLQRLARDPDEVDDADVQRVMRGFVELVRFLADEADAANDAASAFITEVRRLGRALPGGVVGELEKAKSVSQPAPFARLSTIEAALVVLVEGRGKSAMPAVEIWNEMAKAGHGAALSTVRSSLSRAARDGGADHPPLVETTDVGWRATRAGSALVRRLRL